MTAVERQVKSPALVLRGAETPRHHHGAPAPPAEDDEAERPSSRLRPRKRGPAMLLNEPRPETQAGDGIAALRLVALTFARLRHFQPVSDVSLTNRRWRPASSAPCRRAPGVEQLPLSRACESGRRRGSLPDADGRIAPAA